MIQTLQIALPHHRYPIQIGADILHAAEILPFLAQPRVAIITNEVVAPLYLAALEQSLQSSGIATISVVLPDGEAHKNAQTLDYIYTELLTHRCERKTTLLALGGGVVGDITGYAAATYLRGVPFIQLPTTLLAQVDSSVGGKTGINHPLGKNMVGAFYQPQLVLADTRTLDTLPARELSAGLAEVIKYGLIRDLQFFEWLEANMDALMQRDKAVLQQAIFRSCQNKAAVVAADEREAGQRALLNFGHTFGHAVETGMGYGTWLHGEAVAAGSVIAARVSYELGWITASDLDRVTKLFQSADLPTDIPDLGFDTYMELMGLDKKVEAGKIRFVLLKAIGHAVLTSEVPLDVLRNVLTPTR